MHVSLATAPGSAQTSNEDLVLATPRTVIVADGAGGPAEYPLDMFGLGTLARVAGELRRDVAAARERDPAARGVGPAEILAVWPGVHALLAHRVAHALHEGGVPLFPEERLAQAR